MLGAIGFLVTGLIFALFALSFSWMLPKAAKEKLAPFSYAYYLLAGAFWLWSIACLTQADEFLRVTTMVGNGLLLAATICLVYLWAKPKQRPFALAAAAVVSIALLVVRAVWYGPEPQMQDGLLIFNTQTPVAVAIGAIFCLVWFPVNSRVGRLLTVKAGQPGLASIYSLLYGAASLLALIFLFAQRRSVIIVSFVGIGLSYAVLIACNYFFSQLIGANRHGK